MQDTVAATDESSILIVDDDPGAIQIIRRALASYSNVRFATSGKDAMRLVAERIPDLILLDCDMPSESGFEVCARLKANVEHCDIPVIFVTAHDDIHFETRALELGASDFISKPISAPRVQLRTRLHLQLKKQLDQLRALATTDGLTGLANRRTLDEALAREWHRAKRVGRPLSLVMIDVDFFKPFNDLYGHPAGDECLKVVAAAVGAAARRPTDLAGRFGGEEFLMILGDTPKEGACHVAEGLRAAVVRAAVPHLRSAVGPYLTVSVGVSSTEGASVAGAQAASKCEKDLVEGADRALYLAKQRGRNRVEFVALADVTAGRER